MSAKKFRIAYTLYFTLYILYVRYGIVKYNEYPLVLILLLSVFEERVNCPIDEFNFSALLFTQQIAYACDTFLRFINRLPLSGGLVVGDRGVI